LRFYRTLTNFHEEGIPQPLREGIPLSFNIIKNKNLAELTLVFSFINTLETKIYLDYYLITWAAQMNICEDCGNIVYIIMKHNGEYLCPCCYELKMPLYKTKHKLKNSRLKNTVLKIE